MPHARPLRIDMRGGGPTGLAIALMLRAHGGGVRIRTGRAAAGREGAGHTLPRATALAREPPASRR